MHIHIVHEGKKYLKCELCDKSFENKILWKHIGKFHEGYIYPKCESCGKSFYGARYLNQHIDRVHEGKKDDNKTEERNKCNLCDKKFAQFGTLNRHIRNVHNGEKPHVCDKCNKMFAQKSKMKQHINTVHRKDNSEFQCFKKSCGFETNRQDQLLDHISVVHGGNKNFKCYFCAKAFGQSGTLHRHVRQLHMNVSD